jgi:hypothetical protein
LIEWKVVMKKLMKALSGMMFCCLILLDGAWAAGAEVELLLYRRDPWLMVIGSDSPLAACYANGLMIFLDSAASGKSGAVYKSLQLGEAERGRLQARMAALDTLQPYYELSQATDQPTTQLVFRSGGKLKQVSAYGGMPPELAQFTAFLNSLQAQAGARAADWTPPFIEIMLWPFDHARGEPTPWPKEFPGLDSPATVKRGESSYSLYLPSAQKEKFRDFIKTKQGAVLLEGKKWSVAARVPFPHEIPAKLTAPPASPRVQNAAPGAGGAMLPPGRYRLRNAVMEGTFELRGHDGAYRAFIHLTQKESGHTAELEGPARMEGNTLVMRGLEHDGAELSLTMENGRAAIRANERAQDLYSGRNATFNGNYEYAPLK